MADYQAGRDYSVLQTSQTVQDSAKVEVVEFFGYFAPHCAGLEPYLQKWQSGLSSDVVLRRVPVAFGPQPAYVAQQKLYYTLEALGQVDALQQQVFEAMHGAARLRLDNEKDITAWAVKQGLDQQKFTAMFNSFGVASKVAAATKAQNDSKVDGVPLLVVQGRFTTSPAQVRRTMPGAAEAELFAGTLAVLDFLVTEVQG